MEREGFEPSKAEPPDLQSGPFDHSGTSPLLFSGKNADTTNRTRDLLITSQLLYLLSYVGRNCLRLPLEVAQKWG